MPYTKKQQAANREIWCRALESDQYVQGKDRLCNVGSIVTYCCLGVACELAMAAGVPLTKKKDETVYLYLDKDRASTAVLPWSVQDWLGLRTNDGELSENHNVGVTALTSMNDCGCTFKEIAEVIRAGKVLLQA